MKVLNQRLLRKISVLTIVMFVLSTFGAYAQMPQVNIPVSTQHPVDISILNNVLPELNNLQGNLRTAQSTLTTMERVATPLYNQIAPSNMQAMSISQRLKAIVDNAKSLLGNTLNSSGSQAKQIMSAGGSVTDLTYDQQLAYGVEQLSVQSSKLQSNGKFAVASDKLKAIIAVVKSAIKTIVTAIRAKIFAAGQKVGLISKDKRFEEGKVVDDGADNGKMAFSQTADVHYADSFSGKLAKGVSEGTQNAKASLKNSFSFSNLAVTTTVAVGTNLAIDMIHGEKPSFSKAVKQVASLEFAGSVVGSALGAAGGQFTATLVKTFMPGPVGALVGSVIPVMFASASGQMGSNLLSGIKRGEFSVAKAFKQIDKVDLVGSSIGSTIGMALGAPIPVIGPIIGGIVGGLLGSKVAKWVSGFGKGGKISTMFSKGSQASAQNQRTGNVGFPVSIGSIAGSGRGTGPVVVGSQEAGTPNFSVSGDASARLVEVEKKYYETYLQYNRLVEKNDQEGAKKIFSELKKYSDEYSNLKKAVKSGN